jgi:hypothetical protein
LKLYHRNASPVFPPKPGIFRSFAGKALSDPVLNLGPVSKAPSRIELLELDIDTRLCDLWREALEIQDWNLEVVAAFMRAAYGKGYCDALTEDDHGRLCADHGYRVPGSRAA